MLHLLLRLFCTLLILFIPLQTLANTVCGSAPISCNSLHNLSVTLDKAITDTDSATVTVSFMQYANFNTRGAFLLFTPTVTFELDGQYVNKMKMTDITPLIKPHTYSYYGSIYLQALIKYEYQFEWDLLDNEGLPKQLFAALGVKVNAGAKHLATATNIVTGFENDLGPQDCELAVGSQCNMLNGNLYYRQTDYVHQGTKLTFQRHYNSLQKVTSAVTGGDWSSTGGARVIDFSFLLNNGNKLYLYLDEQGQYEYFYQQADGHYKGDDDVDLQFAVTSSGFDISQPNGQLWHHNTAGQLTSTTDPSGNVTQYLYQNNKLSEIKGPYGHSLTLSYDPQGKLSQINTPDGQHISYQYNTQGLLSDVIKPDGQKESYSYNSAGDLTNITRNDTDVIQQNTFDVNGRVLTHKDQKANKQFTFSYQSLVKSDSSDGNKLSNRQLVTNVTDDKGNDWLVTSGYNKGEQIMTAYQHQSGQDTYHKNYDSHGNLTTYTDPQGNITGYGYNLDDQLTSTTRAKGAVEEQVINYEYVSGDINLATKISRESTSPASNDLVHNIEMSYNAQYQVQQVTETGHTPDGSVLSRTSYIDYDPSGRVISFDGFVDGDNDKTELTYHLCSTGNECGQLATITNAAGEQTQFAAYDPAGRITKIIQPNDTVVDIDYDANGNILSTALTSKEITRTTQYQYQQSSLTSIRLPEGETYNFSYDNEQKLSQITDSQGNNKTFYYDARDNVSKVELLDKDAVLHYQINRAYDRLDQIKTVTTINGTTTYNINNIGQLTQQTDALLESDSYLYDSLSRLLKHTDALANETTYVYNNHDQLLEVRDAEDNKTSYEYDDFGRIVKQHSTAAGTSTYQYDNGDKLVTSIDARNITTKYQYDGANRLTQISYPTPGENISFTYANANLADRVTYPSGQSQYTYNGFDELTEVTDTLKGNNFKVSYDYNLNGRLISITYPSGTRVKYEYSNDRISKVILLQNGTETVLASNIHYQPFGPLTQLTYGNGLNLAKSYNKAYQVSNIALTGVKNDDYLYDAIGNMSKIDRHLGAPDKLVFGYDPLDRLITADQTGDEYDYSYDGIGNRLSLKLNGQTADYGYDNHTLLTSISGDTVTALQYDQAGNITQKGNMHLSYNQAGQLTTAEANGNKTQYSYNHLRQRVVKTQSDGRETYYQYLPDGRLLNETDANGTIYKHYIWIEEQLLAIVNKTSSTSAAQIIYAHNDHLNTVTSLSDTSGNLVWTAEYSPFGLATINEDADSDGVNIQFNLRFAGQYFDAESNLHYNINRYYDPETGRYTQSDPIGLAGGMNTYAYAMSNPVLYTDPLGLDICLQNTTSVGGWHQRITVKNDEVSYGQSFGLYSESNFEGIVYEDNRNKTTKESCTASTKEQDAKAIEYLKSQLGNTGFYYPIGSSCRTYSQNQYSFIRSNILNLAPDSVTNILNRPSKGLF